MTEQTPATNHVRRKLKRAVVWFATKIVGRDHKHPAEYQPATDSEAHDSESAAVPALAAGHPALDWVILIGFPAAAVALRLIVVDGVALGVAFGGCIVLGAIFVRFTRGGFMKSTNSPEDPP